MVRRYFSALEQLWLNEARKNKDGSSHAHPTAFTFPAGCAAGNTSQVEHLHDWTALQFAPAGSSISAFSDGRHVCCHTTLDTPRDVKGQRSQAPWSVIRSNALTPKG